MLAEEQSRFNLAKVIKSVVGIAIIVAICAVIYRFLPFTEQANKGLVILFFIGALWLTEIVHTTITALLVPLSAVLLGVPESITLKSSLTSFADPIIFLFFGGFALATALHMQKIDRKIALFMIRLSKGHLGVTVFSLFFVTAGLSMWISNTATAAMMLPLALGIMSNLDFSKERGTFIFILLGIAYSANIGGLGTLVGSPPNAIAAKALNYSFDDWFLVGIPMMVVLMPVMFIVLYIIFKPKLNMRINVTNEVIPWTLPRIVATVLFIVTAIAWISGSYIQKHLGISSPDTYVAITCAIAVVVLGLASWQEVSENTDWGVLFLFGGGLTLSAVLGSSGASEILGNTVADLFGRSHPLVVIFIVVIFIIILTEFTSNTASAALLVPVFAAVAAEMGMPEEVLVLMIGLGASCAFMLPIATPPNAIVFGTGHLRQRDMMFAGGILNLCCVGILTIYAYFFLL
ncbi:anion:sodium symporter [Ignatzschineria sp. F8392]|nr:anion:sodium symporter [Ignatzschineria sp. F8392]